MLFKNLTTGGQNILGGGIGLPASCVFFSHHSMSSYGPVLRSVKSRTKVSVNDARVKV